MEERDAYKVLMLDEGAEEEIIRLVYRRLCLRLHPDKNSSPDAERRMQDVNWAYETLMDRHKRAAHDEMRAERRRQEAESNRRVVYRKIVVREYLPGVEAFHSDVIPNGYGELVDIRTGERVRRRW